MACKNYQVDEVLRKLSLKNDVKIEPSVQKIFVLTDKVDTKEGVMPNPNKKWDLGNGSWGKIDFLKKCGYSVSYVNKFER